MVILEFWKEEAYVSLYNTSPRPMDSFADIADNSLMQSALYETCQI